MESNEKPTIPKKPRRRWRWLKLLVGLVGVLVVLWTISFVAATRELNNAANAVRLHGHPATYEEVGAKLYGDPSSQTGADLIRQALAENERVRRPGDRYVRAGGSFDQNLGERQRRLVRELELGSDWTTVLSLVEQAIALPPGPFISRGGPSGTIDDYEEVHAIRSLSRLMTLSMASAALLEDHDETVRMLRLSFGLSEQLAADQRLLSQLVREGVLGVANAQVHKVLPSLVLNEQRFKTLDSVLADNERTISLQQALFNERATLASVFETPSKLRGELRSSLGGFDWSGHPGDSTYKFLQYRWGDLVVTPVGLPFRRRAAARALQVPDAVLELVDVPPPWPKERQKEYERWRGTLNADRVMLEPSGTDSIGMVATAGRRVRRRLLLTRLALRVQWYAQVHGRLPQKLEDVCDSSMQEIPIKWFESKPLQYSVNGNSFRIAAEHCEYIEGASLPSGREDLKVSCGLLIKMDLPKPTPPSKGSLK